MCLHAFPFAFQYIDNKLCLPTSLQHTDNNNHCVLSQCNSLDTMISVDCSGSGVQTADSDVYDAALLYEF